MLKTALALTCLAATSLTAQAFETPKYDRKIEQAAIAQVGKKLGALREGVDAELPVTVAEIPAAPELDFDQTAGVLERAPVQGPAIPKKFWFVAGVYQ